MKKNLFILFIFAALVSCSDLAPEDSLAADLPKDFEVLVYSKINPDIAAAQLALAIKHTNDVIMKDNIDIFNPDEVSIKRDDDCTGFLQDEELVKEVYLNYAGCPKKGWDSNKPCEGQDAFFGWNNSLYSTESSCSINGCFSGGWDEPICKDIEDCADIGYAGEIETLQEIWEKTPALRSYAPIRILICNFNVLQADGVPSWQEDKKFIEDFMKNKLDSNLIKKHFTMAGRYEGRPYKYCGSNEMDGLRTGALADTIGNVEEIFYDYSANLFCLNKCKDEDKCDDSRVYDGKVYKIK